MLSPTLKSAATIEIDQVKKVFSTDDGDVHAVGPIDLHIAPGDFISLLGPSGCGKSTLMLMIAGLLPVSSGATTRTPLLGRSPR